MKSVFEVKFFLGVFGGVGYPGSAASFRGELAVGMPAVRGVQSSRSAAARVTSYRSVARFLC